MWITVTAGAPTEETLDALLGMLSEGDMIVDGGNSKWTESITHGLMQSETDGNELSSLEGWVEDSGEGRWTPDAGIANDTPMPTLAAALFARFGSRGAGNYAANVTAALRNQFGGHAVKTAPKL